MSTNIQFQTAVSKQFPLAASNIKMLKLKDFQ